VAVGSTNPVKLAAVRSVFQRLEPRTHVDGIAVTSGVPDQPVGDAQTIEGATNRSCAARKALDADLGVGIEGGVVETPTGMRTCAWAVVVTRNGNAHVGGSLSMPLPDAVARLIRDGVELGYAIDQLVGTTNIKHGAGAVGILTEGLVNRQEAYETILAYALAPILGEPLYQGTGAGVWCGETSEVRGEGERGSSLFTPPPTLHPAPTPRPPHP
jgi:inosine/xanthosine triphosphatase